MQSVQPEPRPCEKRLALELCAGSAGLSAELAAIGFEVIAIDYERNRQEAKAATMKADLSTVAGQSLVMMAFDSDRVFYWHAAPPCGTCSKAREIPVSRAARLAGAPAPVPLRSDDHPEGLPDLTGVAKLRVVTANSIHSFIAKLAMQCLKTHDKNIFFTIENPTGSYLWQLPCFRALTAAGAKCFDFVQCRHGGTRPKRTRLLSNCPTFETMCGGCPGDHIHEAWGVHKHGNEWKFATASEAA